MISAQQSNVLARLEEEAFAKKLYWA